MSTDIDLNDTNVLRKDQLKKTGEEYSVVLLSAKNIDQILSLQDIAFANLKGQESMFLANNKDRNFFEKHFANGNQVIGIVHDGRLIAQAIIVNPTKANPTTGMAIDIDQPLNKIAVMQGAIVDPAYRGNNLQGVLVDERMAVSKKNGRTEIYSEVALNNSFSWSVLLKKGLEIEATGKSPYTGADVYVMHGHLPALRRDFAASAPRAVVPQSDVPKQEKLLKEGYKGVEFDKTKSTITFARPAPGRP